MHCPGAHYGPPHSHQGHGSNTYLFSSLPSFCLFHSFDFGRGYYKAERKVQLDASGGLMDFCGAASCRTFDDASKIPLRPHRSGVIKYFSVSSSPLLVFSGALFRLRVSCVKLTRSCFTRLRASYQETRRIIFLCPSFLVVDILLPRRLG